MYIIKYLEISRFVYRVKLRSGDTKPCHSFIIDNFALLDMLIIKCLYAEVTVKKIYNAMKNINKGLFFNL